MFLPSICATLNVRGESLHKSGVGAAVGDAVGGIGKVGKVVGDLVGATVGDSNDAAVGDKIGHKVGDLVGKTGNI